MLTTLLLVVRSVDSQDDSFRRKTQVDIEQLESRLRGDLTPEVESRVLWDLAQRARETSFARDEQ